MLFQLTSNGNNVLLLSFLGWIPGLEIDITFLCGWFSYFKNLELIQLIMLILMILKFWTDSLGIWFWNLGWNFGIAWVAPICVGVSFLKSPNQYIFLHWSFWYIKLRVFVWFHVNPRNFRPRKIHFLTDMYHLFSRVHKITSLDSRTNIPSTWWV